MKTNSETYLEREPVDNNIRYVIHTDFILREIAGEYVLIPVGDSANRFNGMIAVNESFQFIWKQFQTAKTIPEVIAAVKDGLILRLKFSSLLLMNT